MENQAYFEKLCWEGLERRYPGKVTDALRERLTYEINVVKTMGYTNYYLIVYDFLRAFFEPRARLNARLRRRLLLRAPPGGH